MSGLMSSLSLAARALDAQRAGLAVTGNNIANLNTEGYTRRSIQLAEGQSGAGGVDVLGTRARRDLLLDARVRQELPAEGRERAIAGALSMVEASVGAPGASLDAQLTSFFDSFASLAQDPTSTVARDGVVLQGRLLARSFNDIATRLDESRRGADSQIRGAVDNINRLSTEVASLNQAINAANGGEVDGLRDRQVQALKELSALADIAVLQRGDGGVDVSMGAGRAIVMGASVYALETVDTPPNGFAQLQVGGVTVTSEVARGGLAGLLEVRDVLIPGYQVRLDTIAFSVAQQVNTLHQGGTDLAGNAGANFFATIGAPAGAAAAITLDAALAADSDLVAASQTGAPGDNGAAKLIANLRDARVVSGSATFSEGWGQLVYRIGSDAQTAMAQQKSRREVVTQVEHLRDQVSGVSLDEESALLMRYQRAYEANARYFSAVDTMLATLLNMMGN